jgi:DNA polymerase-3 subunit alpha
MIKKRSNKSMKRFEPHSHTHYSNLRLLDSINHPKELINRAIELGLSGIAITDHDCLSSHMEINQYAQELLKTNPDFKIALGNEIYLCETRDNGQDYYHFILIAKNKQGHRALRELSSRAASCIGSSWIHSGRRPATTSLPMYS